MIIDKENLSEAESRIAEQCENALMQIEPAVVASMAVLDHEQLYHTIKDKIPPAQAIVIELLVDKAKTLLGALPE